MKDPLTKQEPESQRLGDFLLYGYIITNMKYPHDKYEILVILQEHQLQLALLKYHINKPLTHNDLSPPLKT